MAAYGAFRRRHAGKVVATSSPPLPAAQRLINATEAARCEATAIAGLAMTGAIHFVHSDEDNESGLVTETVVRRRVFALGVKLMWRSIHCGDDNIVTLQVVSGGFTPFVLDLQIFDHGTENLDTTVDIDGNPQGVIDFVGRIEKWRSS